MTKTSNSRAITITTLGAGIFLYLGVSEFGTFLEQMTYVLLGSIGSSPTIIVLAKKAVNITTVLVTFYFIIQYVRSQLKITWEAMRKLFVKSIAFFIAGMLLSMLSAILPEIIFGEFPNWMSRYRDELNGNSILKLELINTIAGLLKTVGVILLVLLQSKASIKKITQSEPE